MRKKTALIIILSMLSALIIFHLLILTEQIPFQYVWAGKLKSVEEMRYFETFSLALNLLMFLILFIKYRQVENATRSKIIDIFIWGFFGFFLLNTVGNLFAKSLLEFILGTTFTLVLSVLCFMIVKRESV